MTRVVVVVEGEGERVVIQAAAAAAAARVVVVVVVVAVRAAVVAAVCSTVPRPRIEVVQEDPHGGQPTERVKQVVANGRLWASAWHGAHSFITSGMQSDTTSGKVSRITRQEYPAGHASTQMTVQMEPSKPSMQ